MGEVAGEYDEQTALADGRDFQVWKLTSPSENRVFLLTNPKDYSLTYDGLVIAVERRRSRGWQAFGSYTLSKAYGLQPSSGTSAAGTQIATVALRPPPFAPGFSSARTRTISPTPAAACPTIARTCSGS